MGTYVNPCNKAFNSYINGHIYIDKTELIAYTNEVLGSSDQFICVSRPRRFGKSMAANMLSAYYSKNIDSRKLFTGKKIENHATFEEHLNKHNVIRLDVNGFVLLRDEIINLTEKIRASVVSELIEEFPQCGGIEKDTELQGALNRIFSKTGETFIFILDEWDCVFRIAPTNIEAQIRYLDFLRNLFKGVDYTDLVYMTGILPIKKYGEHSAVNMFEEYSMVDSKDLITYFGFTEQEVREECNKRNVDFNKMKDWYDGYTLDGIHIYNPKSVSSALRWNRFQSYWTGTETYEALKVYIDRNFDGLKESIITMLAGGECKVDPLTFQNDMVTFKSKDDLLTLLLHLGYLTYDGVKGCVAIPNQEIKQEFLRAIKNGTDWGCLMKSLDRSLELLKSTWELDGTSVAEGIDKIHDETASVIKYNDENSLACALYIAYYSACAYYAKPIFELPSGKGFADIVYLPLKDAEKPALVVELKWNQSAEGAISQIKNKRYAEWLESYTGDILLVGINYDKSTKKHQCIIEKHKKSD